MKTNFVRLFTALVLVFYFPISNAQEEYHAEIGIDGGISYYLGDANSKLFANPQMTYGFIYRQKFSPRFAAHLNLNTTRVTGSKLLSTGSTITFDNPVQAIDICGEFNFFDYEDKAYKPFSHKYSTFIFAGIGAMYYGYNGGNNFMFSYPFGVGFKMMLGKRFNLNLKWTHSLLLTDQMEGLKVLNNPANLNGSNIFNNDILSTLTVGLTFNIWKEKCNCLSY